MAAKNPYFRTTDFASWRIPILPTLAFLPRGDGELERRPSPLDAQDDLPPGVRLDDRDEGVEVDRLPVDGRDDVAGPEPGLLGRGAGRDQPDLGQDLGPEPGIAHLVPADGFRLELDRQDLAVPDGSRG